MSSELPESWLRGDLRDVHPLLAPLLYSFRQAREDLSHCTEGLRDDQLWERPGGAASIGFHIRHIGGSTDRLLSYVLGRDLTPEQLDMLRSEGNSGASRADLLAGLASALSTAETAIRGLDAGKLDEPRTVGRKQLPTTVIGLLIHIAEHNQRHVGQAIVTAKILKDRRQENLPDA